MKSTPYSPRICYVASPELFSKGAYAVHAMEMCKAMDKLGVEFEAVVPGSFEKRDIFEYYGVEKPFNLKSLPLTRYAGRQLTHGVSSAIYALSNRKRFDLVLTLNIICAAVTAKAGFSTVYDAHHPPVNPLARALFRSFRNSPSLPAVSFNSGGLRRIYVEDGLSESKTVVAHNGAETEDFENRPGRDEIRKQLGISEEKPVVCYCGNTYEGRGIENLIDAAAEIKDALFLIVGGRDCDNAPHIRAAEERGIDNFVVKGFVPHTEVPPYLLASDVLALPYTDAVTIKGGTRAADFTSPMKLFEYMAAGKPIVATAIPTVLEILKDGEDSVVTAPGDRAGFTAAIRRCLDEPVFAEAIGKRAREKARKYTWEQRVSTILSFVSEKREGSKPL